jgi:uncharacterized membrane protein YeaQ/YmgE (transglycosylase-associated protein family)
LEDVEMAVIVFLILMFVALVVISGVFQIAFVTLIPVLVWMLAGMFAGRIMRGRGYGPLGDVLLGLIGGIVGTIALGVLGIHLGGILGGLVVGTIGAVIFVYLVRLVGNSNFAR